MATTAEQQQWNYLPANQCDEQEKERREGGLIHRKSGVEPAADNPAMTTATREEHAKPWKSFPASSKTFMGF